MRKVLFSVIFAVSTILILRGDVLKGLLGSFAGRPFLLFAPVLSGLSGWLWIVEKNFRGAVLVYFLSAALVFLNSLKIILGFLGG